MTPTLYDLIPDHEALLALEPEELAGVILEYFNLVGEGSSNLNRYNFGLPHIVQGYPRPYQDAISHALMEAWMWLEGEGLIAPKPGINSNFYFVTRRGNKITKRADLKAYRDSHLLPKKLLHPIIAERVWSSFIRGDYDTAVLLVFKEVEIFVRNSGGFQPTDIGTDLMRKAFNADNGPLTNLNSPKSERDSLSHLFAGAIGLYKNPQSHRNVSITDPIEAVEMIVLASHLIKIVELRSPTAP